MSWQGIRGQDYVVEQFRRALAQDSLASTFLFVGPPGVGKRSFALKLAQTLLCQRRSPEALDPCGECTGCVQVLSRSHPDLMLVAKPADKSSIPLDLLVGPDDKRMREGLCHDIALRPFMGGYKVAVIDDADDLNVEGANALLKTLEEPPPHSVIILVGTSAEKQLPTIRSRSQIVRFRPLTASDVTALLVAGGHVPDQATAERVAAYGEGSLQLALELCDEELWEFRRELFALLVAPRLDARAAVAQFTQFVDAAGKEAPLRRARARRGVIFALELFRQSVRQASGSTHAGDPELDASLATLFRHGLDVDTAMAATERCLATLEHIDRNANQANYIEAWFDDLAQILSGRRLVWQA
ncbi:MAG: DNA polymerase III subunit [Pirellulales bacterium]|nr:DNA polymerase III subunit [Pirellulales bacterium]